MCNDGLPPRIRWGGRIFTRDAVRQRIREVADYYRENDRPLLLKEPLTIVAIHYLRDGVLPLDNYTTR